MQDYPDKFIPPSVEEEENNLSIKPGSPGWLVMKLKTPKSKPDPVEEAKKLAEKIFSCQISGFPLYEFNSDEIRNRARALREYGGTLAMSSWERAENAFALADTLRSCARIVDEWHEQNIPF